MGRKAKTTLKVDKKRKIMDNFTENRKPYFIFRFLSIDKEVSALSKTWEKGPRLRLAFYSLQNKSIKSFSIHPRTKEVYECVTGRSECFLLVV